MKALLALSALLFAPLFLRAQLAPDTLQNVTVRGSSAGETDGTRPYTPGMQRLRIDSAALARGAQQQISAVLQQELPLFVKTYGFNSLATLQLRGASAAQTLVLWEGVPLANAALGIADLSTVPAFGLSGAEVVYGSSAALFGSGNVGGALRLSTSGLRNERGSLFSVYGGVASFSGLAGGLRGAWTTERLQLAGSVSGQSALNDFSYTRRDGTVARMDNNRGRFGNATASLRYRVGRKDHITSQFWYSNSRRQLPPALFEQQSQASLDGLSLRTLLHWQHDGRAEWYAKAAYLAEELLYRNPVLSLSQLNRSSVLFGEAGVSLLRSANSAARLSANIQHSSMKKEPLRSQRRAALTLSGTKDWHEHRLKLSGAVRGEQVDNVFFLLPGSNASWALHPNVKLRFNVQRTYRAPTLNELYYSPGGNPDLKAERGWHGDAGWSARRTSGRVEFQHDLSGYYRGIKDWVAWFGGAIWTPHNIARVRSRGLETENILTFHQDSATFWQVRANVAYCAATTVSSYIPNDGSIGAQVPYTPVWVGGGSASWQGRRMFVIYQHSLVGKRYVTTDESASVPFYHTGRLAFEYSLLKGANRLIIRAAINNLWNARYEMMSGRPAPGRFGEIGCEWRRN